MPKGMLVEADQEEALAALFEETAKPKRKPIGVRIGALWQGLLRLLLPGFPIASYCPSCWARLELIDDRLVEWQEEPPMFHKGVRFWQCPQCGGRRSEKYAYLTGDELWERS